MCETQQPFLFRVKELARNEVEDKPQRIIFIPPRAAMSFSSEFDQLLEAVGGKPDNGPADEAPPPAPQDVGEKVGSAGAVKPQAAPAPGPETRPPKPAAPRSYQENLRLLMAGQTIADPPTQQKRRGPGRPTKNPATEPLPMTGIASSPRGGAENILELAAEQPMAFKKLFNFFIKLGAQIVHLHANPTRICLYTSDGSSQIRVRAEVAGNQMNHYYCAEDFWISLNAEDLWKIFSCVSKEFQRIRFIYKRTDRSAFLISLSDRLLDKDNNFPMSVSIATPNPQWLELERMDAEKKKYKVSWTVSQAVFKKCHEIATQTSEIIKVSLTGGGNLTLGYHGSGVYDYVETYKDSKKINLQSKLAAGDMFAVDYSAQIGRTLSTAIPASEVTIYCNEHCPILVVSKEDSTGISVTSALERV